QWRLQRARLRGRGPAFRAPIRVAVRPRCDLYARGLRDSERPRDRPGLAAATREQSHRRAAEEVRLPPRRVRRPRAAARHCDLPHDIPAAQHPRARTGAHRVSRPERGRAATRRRARGCIRQSACEHRAMTSPGKKQKSRAYKANAINPVTYEVVRSRLLAITEEMRIALQSVSGSPTVTEASDFFTGLFLPDGSFASMGLQVSFQASVVGHLIRAIAKRPHLSVRDGDMF